jgi:mycothiol system anti-sigma-R factor
MSKDCDEALANLYTYLDAELDGATTDRIRAHLDECSGCNRPFDFEERLKSVVKERLDEEVPDEFVAKLQQALDEEARTGSG